VTAQEFLSAVSEVSYLLLFGVASLRLIRHPGWAAFDTFLFFLVVSVLLLAADAVALLGLDAEPALNLLNWVGISALPLILLRLADDFRPQPSWIMIGASAVFLAVASLGVLAPQPWSPAISLLPVAYVVVLGLYASVAFLREATRSGGPTRRRMQAVALGSGLLAVILLLAGVQVVLPESSEAISLASQLLGLGLVLSYFIGFAPPAFLRRAWQEPAIRSLMAEAADLVQLPDTQAIADQIRERVVAATGADGAAVGLWDENRGRILFRRHPLGDMAEVSPGEFISGRVFATQQPVFSSRPDRDAPERAEAYRRRGIQAVAAAPITSGDRRLGVLVAYGARPPAFTDDVLSLIGIVAEQAALVLRSHQLLQEAAQVQALAEMTRLKDDFLSVVAHDVRTPLTTILINAELVERSLGSDGPNARRISSLRTEALRLKQLVEDYLDVVRAEHGAELRRETHDLSALVRAAVTGLPEGAERVRVEAEASISGAFDGTRIQQLVQNLVGNALKYSPADAPVEVAVAASGGHATLSVTDHGIGIPEADLSRLFERFHRGSNADDRRYGGLGLGLYICRQIATEHGGTIAASSQVGSGTTFTVRLPLEAPAPPAAGEESAEESAPDRTFKPAVAD